MKGSYQLVPTTIGRSVRSSKPVVICDVTPKWQGCRSLAITTARFGFDHDIEDAGVVCQVALVHSQEENPITLSDKVTSGSDQLEIVVVVTNHSDERACCLGAHELVLVAQGWQASGSCPQVAAGILSEGDSP